MPTMAPSGIAVRPWLAALLLTLTAMMWAGNAIAGRLAVGEVSPMLLTSLRWVLAVAMLLPFTLGRVRADWPVLRRQWPFLLAMGAVGYTLFNVLLYSSAYTTSAVNITIIQASMPMLIFALNLAVFRVAIRPLQVVGYMMTLLGVALVAGQGDLAGLARLQVTEGDALMLVASVLYSGYTVALKRRIGLHPLSLLTAMCGGAAVTAVPFAAWEWASGAAVLPATPMAAGVVLYTAVAASVVSQWFYMTGVSAIGANRAGLFINLVPVFGAGLAVAILGEEVALHQALALLLVLGGILIAQAAGGRG
jgi:drug/metabolite transporter (DMT)-like permease